MLDGHPTGESYISMNPIIGLSVINDLQQQYSLMHMHVCVYVSASVYIRLCVYVRMPVSMNMYAYEYLHVFVLYRTQPPQFMYACQALATG